jgi:hypothetical protein
VSIGAAAWRGYGSAAMLVLPDPPDSLPPAPRAFYDGIRTVVAELRPADLDAERVEVDFGDGGVAITFPHAREPEWTLAAQVSRRAAVVFAGPITEHFDDAPGEDWTAPAVDLVARILRGEVEVPVVLRGDTIVRVGAERVWSPGALALWRPARVELIRMDFGARPTPGG